MATDKDLQTLKYIIDTIDTSDRSTTRAALEKHHDTVITPTWFAALRYAEQRIHAIETETLVFADRVLELAGFMHNKDTSDGKQKATSAKRSSRRKCADTSLQGQPRHKVADALHDAISRLSRRTR